jgi:hypothetical protein
VSEFEPRPPEGLPGPLPAGERILWQGKPSWRALAVRAFHVRAVAVYFALLLAYRLAVVLADGGGAGAAVVAVAGTLPLALGSVGILALLAWLSARTTRYTITDRRLVLQVGMALSISLNIPFGLVASASLKTHADGTADIPVEIVRGERVAFAVLWPHARPWHVRSPQPMLRGLADGVHVARVLQGALVAATGGAATAADPQPLTEAPPLAGAPVAA